MSTINLGLVQLGGHISTEPVYGYVFRFSDADAQAAELRGYWRMKQLFANLENVDVRLIVNYKDEATLTIAIKLMYHFSSKISNCYIIFENGNAIKL